MERSELQVHLKFRKILKIPENLLKIIKISWKHENLRVPIKFNEILRNLLKYIKILNKILNFQKNLLKIIKIS